MLTQKLMGAGGISGGGGVDAFDAPTMGAVTWDSTNVTSQSFASIAAPSSGDATRNLLGIAFADDNSRYSVAALTFDSGTYTPTVYDPASHEWQAMGMGFFAETGSTTLEVSMTFSQQVFRTAAAFIAVTGVASPTVSDFNTGGRDNVTSQAIDAAVSYVAGDLVIITACTGGGSATLTYPSGFTELTTEDFDGKTLGAAYWVADTTGSTAYSVTSSVSERLGVSAIVLSP